MENFVSDLKEKRDRANWVTQRVADMEEWATSTKEVLSHLLKSGFGVALAKKQYLQIRDL